MLRLRLPHERAESAESFCSRLAACNGRQNVHFFCGDQGLLFREVVDGKAEALEQIAELGGADPSLLINASIRRIKGTKRFEYRGAVLNRSTMNLNRIMVCPQCLMQDLARCPDQGNLAAYGRTEWLITPIRTCSRHKRSLVDVTPDHTVTRADDYAGLTRDQLGELPVWMEKSTIRETSSLENYAFGRLSSSQPTSATWLDDIPFYAAIRLCEAVGAIVVKGVNSSFRTLTDNEWWSAGAVGFDLLADGPQGIRHLLDQFAAPFWDRKGPARGKAWLGRFHDWLNSEVDHEVGYEPIRRIIRDHLIETLPLGPGDEIFGKPITERRLWSVYSAAREIGAHPKRLRKLLAETGILPTGSVTLPYARATFAADEKAAQFLDRVKGAMPVQKARVYINAPRVQFAILFEAGVIKPFIRGGTESLKDHAFAKADLDDFLMHLLADATDATEADDDLIDIPTCPRYARCSVDVLVRLILDRRLSRVRRRPDEHGFLSVLIDPAEVRSLVHQHSSEYLSLDEIEQITPWSDSAIKGLFAFGCLPFETIQNSYKLLMHLVGSVN